MQILNEERIKHALTLFQCSDPHLAKVNSCFTLILSCFPSSCSHCRGLEHLYSHCFIFNINTPQCLRNKVEFERCSKFAGSGRKFCVQDFKIVMYDQLRSSIIISLCITPSMQYLLKMPHIMFSLFLV